MKALKLLAAASALFAVAACETAPTGTDGVNGGGNGNDPYAHNSSNPAAQADLVNNIGDRVFFELDSSVVTAEGQRTLERQATWLKTKYPSVKLTVEGHADERGTREYNIALGERRATAVKNVLVGLGVDSSRLSTISYGKERPAVLGSSEDAWAQNRRGVSTVD